MRERRWVEDEILYRGIVRALNKYRSHGFTEKLTLKGLERIYKEVKDTMDVDLGKEEKGSPIKTVLPKVAYLMCRECSWKFNE